MNYKRLIFFGGGGGGLGLLGFWGTLVPAFSLIHEHSLIGTSISMVGLGLVFSLVDELSLVGTRIGLVGLSFLFWETNGKKTAIGCELKIYDN